MAQVAPLLNPVTKPELYPDVRDILPYPEFLDIFIPWSPDIPSVASICKTSSGELVFIPTLPLDVPPVNVRTS